MKIFKQHKRRQSTSSRFLLELRGVNAVNCRLAVCEISNYSLIAFSKLSFFWAFFLDFLGIFEMLLLL